MHVSDATQDADRVSLSHNHNNSITLPKNIGAAFTCF